MSQNKTPHPAFERTVILAKPDGIQRGLIGQIISRFELKGLKLISCKMIALDDPILDEWYAHRKDKPFFTDLKNFKAANCPAIRGFKLRSRIPHPRAPALDVPRVRDAGNPGAAYEIFPSCGYGLGRFRSD